jgi:hypothetical protein
MSWQIVPGLVIITGAFTLTGVLMNGFDKLFYGRVSFFNF